MKADLHVHSLFSPDSRAQLEDIIAVAKDRGIGCIAITDHNEFKAFELLKDRKDIIVIPGEEVSSSVGHIIALGIDRQIPPRLSIEETVDLIHEAGGYAYAAHPYRMWSGLGENNT
ncbi:MAG: PHP domain-containing protein, partial [Candidatus Methanomethylophilaceae archaeon]|nr:PHP domain-containing protein [Candidatus Methanomethylophilaceae archaeon]